jgi:DNA repair protein RadC
MATVTIHELPEGDRPREKLAARGPETLSEAELLAVLLGSGLPGTNAVELARALIAGHGSLGALARCTVAEMAKIKGVGPAKATRLAAAFGLGVRLARENWARRRIDSPAAVHDLLGQELRALHRESLRVVLLDTRHQLLRTEEVSNGSVNESIAHPREVFRPAILHSAYAIIVAHNHPSGDPTPSAADHSLTRRLVEVGKLLQIELLDHVVIGAPGPGRQPWFSFREAGLVG